MRTIADDVQCMLFSIITVFALFQVFSYVVKAQADDTSILPVKSILLRDGQGGGQMLNIYDLHNHCVYATRTSVAVTAQSGGCF